jgi:peroxiredoxin
VSAPALDGRPLPGLTLPSTSGEAVSLEALGRPRTVLYVYPMTARPGVALPGDWDVIPGARGCTPEACAFRDHHAELGAAGADVYGVSSQDTGYQREAVERLHLPFALLSDERMELAQALGLPTFTADGGTFFARLTMVVAHGAVEHVFYPVDRPAEHAQEVLDWLTARPLPR